MDYPAQIDCVWLASDKAGRLAAMITAGEGPIPAVILAAGIDVAQTEQILLELPVIGTGQLSAHVSDPTSFLKLSGRGLFVYDWTDIYRSQAAAKRTYELVCSPTAYLARSALEGRLQGIDYKIDADFGSRFVDVG